MKISFYYRSKKAIWLLRLLLPLLITACHKELPQLNAPDKYGADSFSEIFEAFWTGMNNNYVFWDIDTTNWDKIHQKYKPLFEKLDINDDNDIRQSYTYFKEITTGLIDSHYSLGFEHPLLTDSMMISPAGTRHQKEPWFHEPIPYQHFSRTIVNAYLEKGAKASYDSGIICGTLQGNILYFRCHEFNLKEYYETDTLSRSALDYFFSRLKNQPLPKGLVIDLRSNPGGNVEDLDFLLGDMIDQPLRFGDTRYKAGNGRLDYTAWIPAVVNPKKGANAVTAPIVVLADLQSVSMAEITTMAIKSLPGAKRIFVGERTWGAQGPLTHMDVFNGGQFSTRFLNLVYTSSLMLRYKDNKVYEGIGFPPDVEVKYNADAIESGRDPQLEKAVSLIK